jgi:hypothetical protein
MGGKKMKKILSLVTAFFALAGVVLCGQKAEKPGYPFKADNNVATAVFAQKTYDEVWEATLKVLAASDYKATTSEKDAGIINRNRRRIWRAATTRLGWPSFAR